MEQENLEAILVSDRYNVRYISYFTGDTAYLYISKKSQLLLTDARYTTWARAEVKGFEVFQIDQTLSYQEKITQLLEEEQISRIGFENQKMLYSEAISFQEHTPMVKWQPLNQKLETFRQIKSQQELAWIAHAEEIGDQAFSHIVKEFSLGMTELEAAWELETAMRKAGAQGLSFETIVVFGERTAMPHAIPSERKLEKGNLIVMDFGCVYQGYCSDMTRTVVMGKADSRQKEIYETVLQAQESPNTRSL